MSDTVYIGKPADPHEHREFSWEHWDECLSDMRTWGRKAREVRDRMVRFARAEVAQPLGGTRFTDEERKQLGRDWFDVWKTGLGLLGSARGLFPEHEQEIKDGMRKLETIASPDALKRDTDIHEEAERCIAEAEAELERKYGTRLRRPDGNRGMP